jgi:hypothetical protein
LTNHLRYDIIYTERKREPNGLRKKEVITMKTVITIDITKDMDTYDYIMDYVTVYEIKWNTDGTVTMVVNTEEYNEFFGEEE